MEWRSELEHVTYVFGFEPDNVEGYEHVVPREHYTFGDLKVTTTRSTDAGVGFVVQVDGVTVFHPGDHHNRAAELDGIYREDIDWLAAAGVRPDLCFLPISGCGFGDLAPVHAGADYTLETLQPAVFSPMHGGDDSRRYHDFVAEREDRFPGVRMVPVTDRGDRILVGGKMVSAR
jgi:L-ascorbate metabolism protein UlaG (beta-lactamase superfamily)